MFTLLFADAGRTVKFTVDTSYAREVAEFIATKHKTTVRVMYKGVLQFEVKA